MLSDMWRFHLETKKWQEPETVPSSVPSHVAIARRLLYIKFPGFPALLF